VPLQASGVAIISARFVQLTPAAGGDAVTTTIASDGSFHFDKLKPGSYRLVVASRQTQGTTFGEKVNAGLAQTGNAVASGASRSQKAAGPPALRLAGIPYQLVQLAGLGGA